MSNSVSVLNRKGGKFGWPMSLETDKQIQRTTERTCLFLNYLFLPT